MDEKMKRLIQWHKDILNDLAFRFDLSAYQVTWVAFAKGIIVGYIIGAYL